MKSGDRSVRKYALKYRSGASADALQESRGRAVENYGNFVASWFPISIKLKQLLAAQGVPAVSFLGYYGFTHECHAVATRGIPLRAQDGTSDLIVKYSGKGLNPDVLDAIVFELFNQPTGVVPPVPTYSLEFRDDPSRAVDGLILVPDAFTLLMSVRWLGLTVGSIQTLLSFLNGSGWQRLIYNQNGSVLTGRIRAGAVTHNLAANVAPGQWQRAGMRWSGNRFELWVGGAFVGGANTVGALAGGVTGLRVGADYPTLRPARARITRVIAYSRALSDIEMVADNDSLAVDRAGLELEVLMAEGAGLVAADTSGHGRNLALLPLGNEPTWSNDVP